MDLVLFHSKKPPNDIVWDYILVQGSKKGDSEIVTSKGWMQSPHG